MESLHYLLMKTNAIFNRRILAQAGRLGLTAGQPKVLEYLHEHDGCTQKQLGEGCALDKSTVTSLLARMEQQGLVCKQTADEDRRVSLVCLTDTGREQAARVRQGCAEVDALAWGGIPPETREAFLRTMREIISNLQNKGEKIGE